MSGETKWLLAGGERGDGRWLSLSSAVCFSLIPQSPEGEKWNSKSNLNGFRQVYIKQIYRFMRAHTIYATAHVCVCVFVCVCVCVCDSVLG